MDNPRVGQYHTVTQGCDQLRLGCSVGPRSACKTWFIRATGATASCLREETLDLDRSGLPVMHVTWVRWTNLAPGRLELASQPACCWPLRAMQTPDPSARHNWLVVATSQLHRAPMRARAHGRFSGWVVLVVLPAHSNSQDCGLWSADTMRAPDPNTRAMDTEYTKTTSPLHVLWEQPAWCAPSTV